jgi:GTP-binding protein YchF
MEYMERRIDKTKKMLKGGDKKFQAELEVQEKILACLESGKSARTLTWEEDEKPYLRDLFLLTIKPVLYVANIAEDALAGPEPDYVATVRAIAATEDAEVVTISAKIEEEISVLEDEERALFLLDLGLEESGLDKIIKAGYHLLGLMSFLTAGPTEVRAWTIKRGTKAPQAAGKIHSDFERGFIRAEVVNFHDLMASGNYAAAREKGQGPLRRQGICDAGWRRRPVPLQRLNSRRQDDKRASQMHSGKPFFCWRATYGAWSCFESISLAVSWPSKYRARQSSRLGAIP